MNIRFVESISTIDKQQWNALWPAYPFVRHEFFSALENSHCTTKESGWEISHLVCEENNEIIAALPLFIKSDSWGEYVFDWGWAEAYQQNGLNYYPKLLNAIPFTPSTGPRIGFSPSLSLQAQTELTAQIFSSCQNQLSELGGSSLHLLFPNPDHQRQLEGCDLIQRKGYQFHWFNQDYSSFDEFLASFNARKRKALKKERAKVTQANIDIEVQHGHEVPADRWQTFFVFYHTTYLKRSGRYGYLTKEFFQSVGISLPEQTVLVTASRDGSPIAMALYFRDNETLYGRYWGCAEEVDCLHFELCYYQGIEYAIKHKLQRFDPGAQGEHKIQRGFTPVYTCSYHWLAHPGFSQAVKGFVATENRHLASYMTQARKQLPFKEGVEIVPENILLSMPEY